MTADSSMFSRNLRTMRICEDKCRRGPAVNSLDGRSRSGRDGERGTVSPGAYSTRHSKLGRAGNTVHESAERSFQRSGSEGFVAHQRLGDFLRDDWAAAMQPEAVSRGWEFRPAWLPNEKDNTGYRASFRSAGSPSHEALRETGIASPSQTRVVHILLHASHHSGAWAIPARHIDWAESRVEWIRQNEDAEPYYVVVLVDREPSSGFLLHDEDVQRFRYPGSSLVTITDRSLAGSERFRSAAECADLIEQMGRPAQPGPSAESSHVSLPRRPQSPFCPVHHNLLLPRGGRWACVLCDRGSASTGDTP